MKKDSTDGKQKQVRENAKVSGVLLALVQSSITIIVLLLVLLLKVMNADVFEQVESLFKDAMLHAVVTMPQEKNTTHTTVATAVQTDIEDRNDHAVTAAASVYEPAPKFHPPLIDGVITSAYGNRTDPISGKAEAAHEGVDIAAPAQTPLSALTSGTVVEVGYEENGYGNYLIVSCDEVYSFLYAHCSQITVNVGDVVKAGDVVAYVGSTGRSTGNHVHIEWRERAVPIDPMTVLPEETYA